MQPLHLRSQQTVFVVGGVRSLFEFLDLGLEILQVLLLAFSECALSGTVLGLALLWLELVERVEVSPADTYRCGLRSQWLATRLLGLLVFTLAALASSFVVVGILVARALPLLARVGGGVAREPANHIAVGSVKVEGVVAVEVVDKRAFFHGDIVEVIGGGGLLGRGEVSGVQELGSVHGLLVIVSIFETRREEIGRILAVGGKGGQEEVLLGGVQVEGRTVGEVVGGAGHCEGKGEGSCERP